MIKIIISISLFFSIYQSSHLTFAPIIYFKHDTKGNTFKTENNYSSIGGWGLVSKYKNENISIKLDFYNNRFYNIDGKPSNFLPNQGYSWFKNVDFQNPKNKEYDFDVSNLLIEYSHNNFIYYFGKFNSKWGPGKSSLILSNKSPSFPKLGFKFLISKNLNFEYFHAELKTSIIDSMNLDFFQNGGGRTPFKKRKLAAHKLDFNPTPNLNISLIEMVIYSREADMHYLLPFIPFWSIQHYLGDTDNILMSANFKYMLSSDNHIYGALLIDEWTPAITFEKRNRNWFGYQLGFKSNNIYFNQDSFRIEYTWTDHRIYRHRYEINDFYNHDYPLGFWGGPHAQEFYSNYSFKLNEIFFNLTYSNAKRGILSDEMLTKQYTNSLENFKRFGDGYEQISNLELRIQKYILLGLFLECGINFIDWKNAGFDTSGLNNSSLADIKKESLFFGISYNYDFKKEESYIHKDSYKYIIN